ncbi:hypothetical protein K9M79_08110 [Candidatus Woesearchaeota archaeon]|nr:hypothetical protein [Candidatus Woesearchaeota archaeon]
MGRSIVILSSSKRHAFRNLLDDYKIPFDFLYAETVEQADTYIKFFEYDVPLVITESSLNNKAFKDALKSWGISSIIDDFSFLEKEWMTHRKREILITLESLTIQLCGRSWSDKMEFLRNPSALLITSEFRVDYFHQILCSDHILPAPSYEEASAHFPNALMIILDTYLWRDFQDTMSIIASIEEQGIEVMMLNVEESYPDTNLASQEIERVEYLKSLAHEKAVQKLK